MGQENQNQGNNNLRQNNIGSSFPILDNVPVNKARAQVQTQSTNIQSQQSNFAAQSVQQTGQVQQNVQYRYTQQSGQTNQTSQVGQNVQTKQGAQYGQVNQTSQNIQYQQRAQASQTVQMQQAQQIQQAKQIQQAQQAQQMGQVQTGVRQTAQVGQYQQMQTSQVQNSQVTPGGQQVQQNQNRVASTPTSYNEPQIQNQQYVQKEVQSQQNEKKKAQHIEQAQRSQSVEPLKSPTIRQISQEEIIKQKNNSIQLSAEELQKTQVLNLSDVEKAAKLERFTSKKPAIAFAVVGIFFLSLGIGFKTYLSYNNKKVEDEKTTQQRKVFDDEEETEEEEAAVGKNVVCTLSSLNNPDGTNAVLTVNLSFKKDKLVGFKKLFEVEKIVGNALADTTINNYLDTYQSFLNPTEGYVITLIPNQNGFKTNVEVDFSKLKLNNLNPIQQTHFSTSVDLYEDSSSEVVTTKLTNEGYDCK